MITVWTDITDQELRIGMAGHAGFAEHGQDIVCAAASMLVQAIAGTARLEGTLITDDTAYGRQLVRIRRTERSEAQLAMYRVGMLMLQDAYPDCVQGRNPGPDDGILLTKEGATE